MNECAVAEASAYLMTGSLSVHLQSLVCNVIKKKKNGSPHRALRYACGVEHWEEMAD